MTNKFLQNFYNDISIISKSLDLKIIENDSSNKENKTKKK